jgi:hypothetical protein
LLGIVGVAFALRALGQWRWSAKQRALLDRLGAARIQATTERFDPQDLDALPAPVARFFSRVLPPGTPIIRAVDVIHEGSFNVSPAREQWRPFTSRQRVIARRPGFLWDGRVSMLPGLAVHVHDAYIDGEGILEPALAGLFTLANLRDRDEMARSELMRFFAEAAWYPTALLPSQGVRWEPLDDRSARATLVDGRVTLSMTFRFGEDGLIEAIQADRRGRTVGDQVIPTPWEGRLFDYQRRDGILIPVQGEVAWLTPEGRKPYWRGAITRIVYQT